MKHRLIFHTPEPSSSAGRYVYECLKALSDEGIKSAVVCPANHDFIQELTNMDKVDVFPSMARTIKAGRGRVSRLLDNMSFVFSSAWTLFRHATKEDIVHFQYAIHFPLELIFFLTAKLKGSRIVFTAHDPLPHKWSLPRRFQWIEIYSLRCLYRLSDIILVHSNSGKSTIKKHFPDCDSKVNVIVHGPYTMNSELMSPSCDRLELLFFGALRENKGPHLAIEATQRLYRAGFPVHLTIAGKVLNAKEKDYWSRTLEMIKLQPEPITLREEFIPDEAVASVFSACHCLLLPYGKFFSDSGVAFLALANGKPILSTNAGGLRELLEQSQGGLVIEDATVEAVEAAIRKAYELGFAELEAIGRRGTEWVLETCSWKNVALQSIDAYRKL